MLAEVNHFDNVENPLFETGKGFLYAASGEDACMNYLDRACEENTLVNSGNFTSRDGTAALEAMKPYPAITGYPQGSDQTNNSEQQSSSTGGSVHQSEQQSSSSGYSVHQSEQLSPDAADGEAVYSGLTED